RVGQAGEDGELASEGGAGGLEGGGVGDGPVLREIAEGVELGGKGGAGGGGAGTGVELGGDLGEAGLAGFFGHREKAGVEEGGMGGGEVRSFRSEVMPADESVEEFAGIGEVLDILEDLLIGEGVARGRGGRGRSGSDGSGGKRDRGWRGGGGFDG